MAKSKPKPLLMTRFYKVAVMIDGHCIRKRHMQNFSEFLTKEVQDIKHYETIILDLFLSPLGPNEINSLNQLFNRLTPNGTLYMRESLNKDLKFYQIANILEANKIMYTYKIKKHFLLGKYIELTCYKKSKERVVSNEHY